MANFYTKKEIETVGFKKCGNNVLISRKCSIYDAENISIGNNVRIDDFCILSGNIEIGDYVHISAYSAFYGKYGIKIGNFCGISPKSIIFSATDDFSGDYMISPMVDNKLIKLTTGTVILKDYCQIGTNSTIMPNVTFNEGAVCGAYSFVKNNLKSWNIYAGIPAKIIKQRNQNTKKIAEEFYGKSTFNCNDYL